MSGCLSQENKAVGNDNGANDYRIIGNIPDRPYFKINKMFNPYVASVIDSNIFSSFFPTPLFSLRITISIPAKNQK